MNALWLERFAAYRASSLALESAKALLALKDNRRSYLLARYHAAARVAPYAQCMTFESAFLTEARNAKAFWRAYAGLLPPWARPFNRRPRAPDPINNLLDVGYHHLATMVEKIILANDISPSLGLIHRAHRSQSKPLVYDLMELFRADMVDFALLRYLRLKKRPITDASKHIGHFLSDINTLRDRLYYLKDFKQCHRYSYYMELQVTKLIKAANHKEVYAPLVLPRRHETRCNPLAPCVTHLTMTGQQG